MSNLVQGKDLRLLRFGRLVKNTAKGLTQNAGTNLYTVSGGGIMLTSLLGVVSTAVPNTSMTIKLQHTPSGGSAGDLNGATNIQNDAIGTIYSLVSGVATDLLSIQSVSIIQTTATAASEVPTVTYAQALWNPLYLPAGTLSVLLSNADPSTAKIDWKLTYVPLDDGATVAAA